MNSEKEMSMQLLDSRAIFYAVYDSDVSQHASGGEIAFIEQRCGTGVNTLYPGGDETYFDTLSEAKHFVKQNYVFGAEYFSSNQLDNPDSLSYLLADKLVYLMA